ncbi:AAA family ATPase [Humidisolicoccus flavus]|uniref:AAA family ATPase n=1 Tax=Humidisolicoccus flavus TaxID=3111414 RepID=UPI003253A813
MSAILPGERDNEPIALIAQAAAEIVANVERVVIGKAHVIRLVLTSLLSEGHLLIEDNPGTGKTSLARALAATIDGSASRVQFTPDLLPSDITGVGIWDQHRGDFEFRKGPVFANIVLADEINRASPKTQSALLEVMEEARVTVDGVSHDAPRPFMVIATQNPIEQSGTYRLPEAQLDRFALKTSIGYPDHASTLRILEGATGAVDPADLQPIVTTAALSELIAVVRTVHVDPSISDYIARLVEATRIADEVRLGVSVRGALAFMKTARAYAAIDGRAYVTPDDVKALAIPVLAHRIVLEPEAEFDGVTAESIVQQLVIETPPPRDRLSA